MSVVFTKTGLFCDKWNPEKKKNIRRRVKKLSVFTHLRDTCEIEEGVTLLDIFRIVAQYKVLKVFISQYSWCLVDAFHAQAEEPNDEDEDPEERLTYLQLYWMTDWTDFEGEQHIEIGPAFHGVGPALGSRANEGINGEIHWGIDFSPAYRLANLPVKLDKSVEFFKPKDHGRKDPIVKGTKDFSLQDVLDGIYWEISFYGSPQKKAKTLDELAGQVEDIKNGTAKLLSMDEVFKDLDK